MTITSFFSDQMIFDESSLQFDHELDEWSNTRGELPVKVSAFIWFYTITLRLYGAPWRSQNENFIMS